MDNNDINNNQGGNSTTIDALNDIKKGDNPNAGLGDRYENVMTNIAANAIGKTTGLDDNIVRKALAKNKNNQMFNPKISQKMASRTKNSLNNISRGESSSSPFDRLKSSQSSPRFNKPNNNGFDSSSEKSLNNQGKDSGKTNPINKMLNNTKEQGKTSISDQVQKAVKKTAFKVAIVVVPYVLLIFMIIIVAYIAIMLPMQLIGDRIDELKQGAKDTTNSLVNLLSGDGFTKSSDLVVKKINEARLLYEKNDCSNKLNCYEGMFDEGILIATIQHNNIISSEAFDVDYENVKGEEYQEEKDDTSETYVSTEQTNSFYNVQNRLLGTSNFDNDPHNHGLIYWLVDYKIDWTCTEEKLDQISSYIEEIAGLIDRSYSRNKIEIPLTGIIAYIRDTVSFNNQGLSLSNYLLANSLYSFNNSDDMKVVDMIFASSPKQCPSIQKGDKIVPTYPKPYAVKYSNYNNYVNYLTSVYVPKIYLSKVSFTEEEKEKYARQFVEDVVSERNEYYKSRGINNTLIVNFDETGKVKTFISGGTSGALRGDLASIILPHSTTGFNGTVHFYSQTNYANYPYYGTGPSTIASSGCGPTSLSIAISSLLNEEHDPVELTHVMCQEKHVCTYGDGTYRSAMESIPPLFGIKSESVGKNTVGVQKVLDALTTGDAIVIAIMGPGHFTNGGHFITLTGVNDQGQVFVVDPNNGEKRGKNKWWDLNIIVSENDGNYNSRAFWILTKG